MTNEFFDIDEQQDSPGFGTTNESTYPIGVKLFQSSLKPDVQENPPGGTYASPTDESNFGMMTRIGRKVAKTVGVAVPEPVQLYNKNVNYLNTLSKKIYDSDVNLATDVFMQLGKTPTLNNKPIKLEDLPTAMQDFNTRQAILKQVGDAINLPGTDFSLVWKVFEHNINSTLLNGVLKSQATQFNQDLAKSARGLDVINKLDVNNLNLHSALFNNDGILRSKEEYEALMAQRKKQMLDELDQSFNKDAFTTSALRNRERFPENRQALSGSPSDIIYPKGSLSRMFNEYQQGKVPKKQTNQAVVDWMRKNYPSDATVVKQGQGQQTVPSDNLLYTVNAYNRKRASIENLFSQYDYDRTLKRVVDAYESPTGPGVSLDSKADGTFFKYNKGGAKQAIPQNMTFNLAKPLQTIEGVQDIAPETTEFGSLFTLIKSNNPEVRFALGDKRGDKIPTDDAVARELVTNLMGFVEKDLNEAYNYLRDNKAVPKANTVKGNIKFQAIASGDPNWHAFVLKLDPSYTNQERFNGSKDNPKLLYDNDEVKEQGITIFVPAQVSAKSTMLGYYSGKASSTSAVEALLETTDNINIELPKAGKFQILKDPVNNTIKTGGYTVQLNPQTNRYDTVHVPVDTLPYDKTYDLDAIFQKSIGTLKTQLQRNYIRMEQLREIKGVKNVNQQ